MARHAEPRTSRRSALLKAGLTATAAGAAVLGLGAAGAQAAAPNPVETLVGSDATAAGEGLLDGVGHGVGPLTRLQLDPLANTGVDPLDNGLGTQIADFKPVGTNLVTDHVTKGGAVADLPVVGEATQGLLPG